VNSMSMKSSLSDVMVNPSPGRITTACAYVPVVVTLPWDRLGRVGAGSVLMCSPFGTVFRTVDDGTRDVAATAGNA
jgi:hypothetical protein